MTERIYKMRKGLEYIEGLSDQELTNWVRRFLAENRSHPLSIPSKDTYKSTILLQFYFMSTNSDFRRRFERASLDLVNSWRASADPSWQEPADSLDYFAELLAIVGRIRISDTYSRLLVLAKSEELKKKVGLGVDLHSQLLRVLFGFGMDENRQDLEYIIDRDIEDLHYTALCFRRSWELDFQKGIENLPILLEYYHRDHSIDAEGTLNRFIRRLGQKGFKKEFLNMLQKLRDPYYTDLCNIMKNIGIEPDLTYFEESDRFLIRWREKDKIIQIFIEIPEKLNEKLKKPMEAMYLWMTERDENIGWSDIVPQPAPAPGAIS
ncbi:MAG: hypothetical protein AYK18_13165 [Theionarchaea archaeon DG-70]|nr:MAG: hypothetical protein AYK18_13165 [Theionarchaea archaeon DG-70]